MGVLVKKIKKLINNFLFHNPMETVLKPGFFIEKVLTGSVVFRSRTPLILTINTVMSYAWKIARAAASYWGKRMNDKMLTAKEFIDSALSQAWNKYNTQEEFS